MSEKLWICEAGDKCSDKLCKLREPHEYSIMCSMKCYSHSQGAVCIPYVPPRDVNPVPKGEGKCSKCGSDLKVMADGKYPYTYAPCECKPTPVKVDEREGDFDEIMRRYMQGDISYMGCKREIQSLLNQTAERARGEMAEHILGEMGILTRVGLGIDEAKKWQNIVSQIIDTLAKPSEKEVGK